MRYVLLASGMALFGSATPVSKLVGDAFPSFLASGLRMATAAAILLPFLLAAGGGVRPLRETDRRDRLLLAAIGAVGTFGFTLLLLLGLQNAPGAVAAVVMATTPAVTAAGAVALLGERIDRASAVAIVLAVSGVVLVNLAGSGGGGDAVLLGSLLVFGAVCCEAAYTLLGKRLTAELTPVAIATAAAVVAGALFLPVAVWQSVAFDWSSPGATDWLALAWWGAATMGLGSVLWFRGMRRVSSTTASAFMAVMPVSALVLSYVLLDEAFELAHAAGMAVVLGAIAVVTWRDARRS